MEEVYAQPLAPPAHIAEGAVVDAATGLIVKEVADVAVVARQAGAAAVAGTSHRLLHATHHAHHLGHSVAVHAVIADIIMAQPAGMQQSESRILNPHTYRR